MRLLVAACDGARVVQRLEVAGVEVVRLVDREAELALALRTNTVDAVVAADDPVGEAALEHRAGHGRACAYVFWLDQASTSRAADLLESGADDVVHAGMGERELRARLGAAIERSPRHGPAERIEFHGLEIDVRHGEASWKGNDLRLTGRERQVLRALVAAEGRAVRREAIYRAVWGFTMARGDRSVDVNVKRLRDKLAAAGSDVVIKTQPGIGYRVEAAETPAEAVTAS